MSVELRQLSCFVAVAEELSFTRAAQRMHLVQSGVSATVRSLERELGAELLERTTPRVALTGAGAALLPEARAALAAARRGREAVARSRGTVAGTLTIGTIQSALPLDLPAVLGSFHRAHPHVAIRLRNGPAGSATLADELQSGMLDLAFVSLPRAPARVELHHLSTVELVLVCPPGHRLATGGPVGLDALADEPVIDFPPGYGNRVVVDRAFAAEGLERAIAFEVAEFDAAVQLVRNGLGIAFLPRFVAEPLHDLCAVTSSTPLTMRMSVARSTVRAPSTAARTLLAAIAHAAGDGEG